MAVELLTQIASVGLVLALVLVGAGLVPFLGVGAVTGLGLLAVTVVFVRGLMPLRPAFSVSRWREVLRQTLPVALGGAVHSLYFRSVILLMSLIAPEVQTGYFATSFRIVEVLLGIPVVLVSTTFPVLARAAHRDRARLAYATQQIAEIAGVWMATGTAIGARIAVEVLAGRGADPSVPVLRVQAVTLLLAFISATSATALLSLRRQRELVVCSALALALTTGLTLALVPLQGARGAAIAATAGEAGLTLAFGLALRRSAGLRLTFGQLPRVLAAAAIAAGAAVVPRWPDVVALLVFTAVYWALLAVTRTIPSEVRLALLAPFRRSAG